MELLGFVNFVMGDKREFAHVSSSFDYLKKSFSFINLMLNSHEMKREKFLELRNFPFLFLRDCERWKAPATRLSRDELNNLNSTTSVEGKRWIFLTHSLTLLMVGATSCLLLILFLLSFLFALLSSTENN